MFFKTHRFNDYVKEQSLWKDAEYGITVHLQFKETKKKKPTLGKKRSHTERD